MFFNELGSRYDCTMHYNFEFYEFTDKILYEEININDIETIDLTNIIIKPTRYNYSHYCNCYKMVPFNDFFQVPCILYFTTQVNYDTVVKERDYVRLVGVQTMSSNIEILFRKIYGYQSHNNGELSICTHYNGELSICTHYNDVTGIENKTSTTLCLIIRHNEALFNLFPSSANF